MRLSDHRDGEPQQARAPTRVAVAFLASRPAPSTPRRFVVTRRPAGVHLAGFWELPGGKVEAGEEPRWALERELREELGVEASIGDHLATCRWRYGGRSPRDIELLAFWAHVEAGSPPPRPLAAAALRLVSASELLRLPFPPANAPLLTAFREAVQAEAART